MTKPKRAPQVAVVGCGGTTFEALGTIAIHVSLTGADALVLIDPDTFEQGNADRQLWGDPGEHKVTAAADVFRCILPSVEVVERPTMCQWWQNWDGLRSGDTIIALPDNLEGQAFCYEQVVNSKKRVIFACGGSERATTPNPNRPEGAEGIPHLASNGGAIAILVNGSKNQPDYLRQYHPEMFATPNQVVSEDDETPSCTDVPEQTALDNLYTATCLARALAAVRAGALCSLQSWKVHESWLPREAPDFWCPTEVNAE